MNGRALTAAAILGTSAVSGGWLIGRGLHDETPEHSSARLFDAVAMHIRRHYVDSLSGSALFERAMVGMLRQLHDPYTMYLPPQRLRRLQERTTGNYVGIGAQIQRRDQWPMIAAPFPGSPAERAGLATGDRVMQVDGRSTRRWTVEETVRALRGPPGTTVELVVERPGDARRRTLRLTRDGIHRRAVARTVLLGDGVGYVDVNTFNDSTVIELRQAIDSLRGAGMRSLVLDLRDNPGGVLAQGVSVAELFLDASQPIVRLRGRAPGTSQVVVDSAPQVWPELPLVVLIDGFSASASEIVAGALQDHDRAVLLGRTTFGKGSAQQVFGTSTGGGVKLTTARWYTPLGRSIERARPENGGAEAPQEGDTTRRQFRTQRGRTVLGGGGIVPDIEIGDTSYSPAEQALHDAIGTRAITFRDAMVDVAIALRARDAITSRDFSVTPEMLDALWSAVRRRGFAFDRRVFDGAAPLISRLLGREIARYIFGPQAEAERAVREDPVVTAAVRLAANARSPEELLDRAARAAR